jgi:hypothetical protein
MRVPDLSEIYSKLIRNEGSHATWEPGTWLLPGDCGPFQRGVFGPSFALSEDAYTYEIVGGAVGPQNLKAAAMKVTGLATGVALSDPLRTLAAGGSVTYRASQAEEVLLLARSGRSWGLRNVNKLLRQVQARIASFPVNYVIVCEVFATSAGVAAVSSASGQEFSVGVDASTGLPTIGVKTAAGVATASHLDRTFEFSAYAPASSANPATPPGRDEACMPLFKNAYRVKKDQWRPLGLRKHLVTMKGDKALIYDDSGPGRLIADPSDPDADLDLVKALPVDDLFEVITPGQLNAEMAGNEDMLAGSPG